MAPILSLPVEILLQIFQNESLTAADVARCARTCRLFHDTAATCKIDYNFQVDDVSRSAWRLIRCLLVNPALGQRFRKITVTWHRRRPRKPKTWAKRWRWTRPGERAKLAAICDRWPISHSDMKKGMNSEVLLPILLFFTPKLESIDFGQPITGMIYPGFTYREGIRIWEHCQDEPGCDFKWTGKDRWDDGRDYFQAIGAMCIPDELLWFYTALDPNDWLPGLSNIKEFSHGSCTDKGRRGWPAKQLPKIMLLPHLETLRICRCSALQSALPKDIGFSTRKSPIKRLELINCIFRTSDYETLAGYTGSLKSLRCVIDETPLMRGEEWKVSPEDLVDIFLDSNGNTLSRDQITIERSDFLIPPKIETDFGPDDDSYYYKSENSSDDGMEDDYGDGCVDDGVADGGMGNSESSRNDNGGNEDIRDSNNGINSKDREDGGEDSRDDNGGSGNYSKKDEGQDKESEHSFRESTEWSDHEWLCSVLNLYPSYSSN
ncbi:hypothetical protein TWF281_007611 [Arthrobotrys megalospora]